MHGFLGLPYLLFIDHNNNYLLIGISQIFKPCIPIKYYIIFGIYFFCTENVRAATCLVPEEEH